MRLTSFDKKVFVRAVLADLPLPVDNNDKIREVALAAHLASMPDAIKALHADPELNLWLNTDYFYGSRDIPRQRGMGYDASFTPEVREQIGKLQEEQNNARATRYRAERELLDAIKGITTLKKLQAAFPELVRYMPRERDAQTTPNLPAVSNNIVASLVKLGLKVEAQ